LAEALGRLFVARARGEIPFFSRVIVPCPPDQEATLAASLRADPVTAARFRFAGRLAG
jgi:elongation factor P--beta-lysine ligase